MLVDGMRLVSIIAKSLERPLINHIKIRPVATSPAFILLTAPLAEDRHSDGPGIRDSGTFWVLTSISPLRESPQILRIGIERAIATCFFKRMKEEKGQA
jgi:hypothetical protein